MLNKYNFFTKDTIDEIDLYCQEQLSLIQNNIKHNQISEIKSNLHRLKGTLIFINSQELNMSILNFETKIDSLKPMELRLSLEEINTHYFQAIQEIKKQFNS